ncbi:MAG TPA: RDD family protein [Vicinamibacterales bacterium]|nr:RDD family protein [Vicinamibacterales bacterium]
MKRKLIIAALALGVVFSGVISVATVGAFVREKSRADYLRSRAWQERIRAQYVLAAAEAPQGADAPQVPEPAEPATPRRGRGAPPPAEPPTLSIDTPRYDDQFPTDQDIELWGRSRDAMRLGQNLTVGPNDVVRDAIVVFGDATIAGRVTGDVHVYFGNARIQSTAVIDGDLVSVGGTVTVQPGATARRDLVIIGGPLEAPAEFAVGGEQVVIGAGILGGSLNAVAPYLSRGLVWGRLIVPDFPWVWGIVSLFFLLYAALNLIFDRPVRACAGTLRSRPLTAFGAGLLVLLLIGPICVLLAVSIIGIAVVPFVICAAIAGAVIGKVAVARWIGMTAVEEDPESTRAHGARSFVIGFAVLTIAYVIPVVGIITWGITGVLGLGSSALAFMAAYRRENPAKAAPVMVPPPPVAAPPPPTYSQPPAASAPSAAFDGSAAAIPTAPPPIAAPAAPVGSAPYAPPYAVGYAAPAYAASGLLVAQPRALFRDRLAAFFVDVVLVGVSTIVLSTMDVFEGPEFFPLLLIYFIVFWTWKQTTFGGIVCQIRLVRMDGTALSFADSLVRALAGIFSLAVFALGALWIFRDPERQAWHDKIAGTYVVKVPRSWPV